MSLFGIREKKQIAFLNESIAELKSRLTPEQQDIEMLQAKIKELNFSKHKAIEDMEALIKSNDELSKEISRKKEDIIQLDEEILLQSFGLYKPKYDFDNSEKYRAELEKIRTRQKEMIKSGNAVTGNSNWNVNGSVAKGKKMVKDMQKLLLRAFNNECDDIVSKVKYNNFEASLKRITSSCEAISKLGNIMDVSIRAPYFDAKIDELRLALEYQQMKQKEKEDQKEARELMREEAKLQKEIEGQRRKLEKEQTHYQGALEKINAQIAVAAGEAMVDLIEKKTEIEKNLTDIERAFSDVDYRQANQRAGYVYVVSNIGAFGENVFKIGMTRRLNPQERIDELGDASVPFNFDIHAMIFSDDAPALEAALHKRFDKQKLNWVNTRREFFRCTLDEIKEAVKEHYEKTAEFADVALAEQYHVSMRMKRERNF